MWTAMADIIKAFYLNPARGWVVAYVILAFPVVAGACIANLLLGLYGLAFLGLGIPLFFGLMGALGAAPSRTYR